MSEIPAKAKRALQRWTSLLAMSVRNEMEDFHREHLTDDQMKELNPLVRKGIFTALRSIFLLMKGKTERHRLLGGVFIVHWLAMIPDYWEVADLTEDQVRQEAELLRSNP